MINNKIVGVHLNEEQTKQLQVFYTRLTNLRTETSIATKILENVKQEIVKVSMEKKYLEDSLEGLRVQATSLKQKAIEHAKMVQQSTKELTTHREESNTTDSRHASKHDELSKREKELEEKESAHVKQVADFTTKSKMLSEERLAVNKAKDAFQKATESIVWK